MSSMATRAFACFSSPPAEPAPERSGQSEPAHGDVKSMKDLAVEHNKRGCWVDLVSFASRLFVVSWALALWHGLGRGY